MDREIEIKSEILKIRKYFFFIVIISFFILLFCFLTIFSFVTCSSFLGIELLNCPNWVKTEKVSILITFPAILATVAVFIFAIPSVLVVDNNNNTNNNRRKIILAYFIWLVPNILFPIFLIGNIIELTEESFRLSIILFTTTLILFIPYILIFIHSNTKNRITYYYRKGLFLLLFFLKFFNSKSIKLINDNTINFSNLLIKTLEEHDYSTFKEGVLKFEIFAKIIINYDKINERKLNEIIKNVFVMYKFIAIECQRRKLERRLHLLVISMTDIIKFCISSTEFSVITKNFNYTIFIHNIALIGDLIVTDDMDYTSSEVIDGLGQIAEYSIKSSNKIQFLDPPENEVISSLSKIGIHCAIQRKETASIEILNRIESIALLSMEFKLNKTLIKAIKSQIIVCSFIYKYIPEYRDNLKLRQNNFTKLFELHYKDIIDNLVAEMDNFSSIEKKVVEDYVNSI